MDLSPYVTFSQREWGRLRADTPLTLDEKDLDELQGLNESVSLSEVEAIYLPLSRLLNLYVEAMQGLYQVTATFLGHPARKVPYIIGLAGSVAVGKSTTARILQALLSRWPNHPRVDLVTTDGFLYPNKVLEKRGLMERKGFPESYDQRRLLEFVSDLKAGNATAQSPVYSHLTYDIVENDTITVTEPDIVIVEGLNVLASGTRESGYRSRSGSLVFVSDFFDFTIYVDALVEHIEKWYVERFLKLRNTAFQDSASYFHRYADLDDADTVALAQKIWRDINEVNLIKNILPTKERAQLILSKGSDHSVREVKLRKI